MVSSTCGKCGKYRQDLNSISFKINGYAGVPPEIEVPYCADCLAQIVKGVRFDLKRSQGNFNRREDYPPRKDDYPPRREDYQVRRVRSHKERTAYNR